MIAENVRLAEAHEGKAPWRSWGPYLPAESNTGMFGGNSNWRGPIWMPMQALIIRALLQFYLYYGDNFKVECPTGSGKQMNLFEVSQEITNRLTRIFLREITDAVPSSGGPRNSKLIPTGAISFSSTNIFTVTTELASAPAIKLVGRGSLLALFNSSATWMPRPF